MSYREDAKIDIYNLHTEWAGQPSIYIDYAEQYADAVAIMMRADEKVKVVKTEGKKRVDEERARLDADIRINPYLYGLDPDKKPTEAAIAGAIILHVDFKKIQDAVVNEIASAAEAYIEAVRNKELLEGVKIAFSHRKAALENEVQLFLNQYYADPKIPKPYKEAQQEEVRQAIQDSLQDMKGLKEGDRSSVRGLRRRPV